MLRPVMTGWGTPVDIRRRFVAALGLAGAIAAGAAMLSTCSPHEKWTSCRMVHDVADKEWGWAQGMDYSHGAWTDADGKIIGYSEFEDSKVYNTAYCARVMQPYLDDESSS